MARGPHRGAAAPRGRRRRHGRLVTRRGPGPRPTALAAAGRSTRSTSCSPTRPRRPCTSPAPTTSTPPRRGAVIDAGQARRLREAARRRQPPRPPTWSARAARRRRGQRRLLQPPLLPAEPERRRAGRRPARSASRGWSPGSYHQDWLLLETDWNWRLDADRQGSAAGRGRHRLALARPRPASSPASEVVEVLADLHTFVAERNHPVGEVETFAAATRGRRRRARAGGDGERRRRRAAAALRRRRARRVHVSARCRPGARTTWRGRSTAPTPRWRGSPRTRSACGSATAAGPTSSSRRTRPLMTAGRRRRRGATRPDTSRATPTRSAPCSPRSTPTSPPARPSAAPDVPDVRRRARRRRRVRSDRRVGADRRMGAVGRADDRPTITSRREHADEARPAHRRLPRHPARARSPTGPRANGFAMPRGGLLAAGRGPVAPLRRRVPHRLRRPLRRPRPRIWSASSPSGASRSRRSGYYPNPLHPDLDAPRRGRRPPAHGDRCGGAARRRRWSTRSSATTRTVRYDENFAEFAKVWPDLVRHAADHGVQASPSRTAR